MFSLRLLKKVDYLLLIVTILLLVAGWFVVYSSSLRETADTGVEYATKQLLWIGVGIVVFLIALSVDYHFWLKTSFVLYGIVVVLLLIVVFLGETRYGARRWLSLAGFNLQPSELAKIAIILSLTRYLVIEVTNREKFKYLFVALVMVAPVLLLIFKQPDLGTAIIFVPTILVMLFVAGIAWKYIITMAVIGGMSLPAGWFLLKEYQKKRLITFLYPEQDPLGAGYSIIQSKIAVGSGGILGKGWLGGTQNQLDFLPQRHTDFAFSVIGEEWGFVGALIILILFFLVIARGFDIAQKAHDLSGRLLAVGLITIFSVQVAVNVAMTIGIMPVTGLPLPFISYGGTSLLVTMASLGLLQNIYMRRFVY